MATAKPKRKFTENPDSQNSSPIKLLILKKCSFAWPPQGGRGRVLLPGGAGRGGGE